LSAGEKLQPSPLPRRPPPGFRPVRPELRNYQLAAVGAVEQALVDRRSVLIAMATGTGKTIVFGELAQRAARMGWKVLILAHRDELLAQARGAIHRLNPRQQIGLVKAETRQWEHAITVASVQSLREKRLAEIPAIHFVITDEAHHADAPSYEAIYGRLRERFPDVRHLGVTATPFRAHKRERGVATALDAFEARVFEYGLLRAVGDGWLAELRALAPVDGFHLEGMERDRVTGDFSPVAVEKRLNHPHIHARVIADWKRVCGRKAIVFCATIRHAKCVADAFRQARVPAAALWSGMQNEVGKGEREKTIARYREGSLTILTNVGIVTEGFDDPDTAAVVMLRPTASPNLYSQMIGRVTRPTASKPYGLVLDYTGNTRALDVDLPAARLSDLAEVDLPIRPPTGRPGELYEVFRIERRKAA